VYAVEGAAGLDVVHERAGHIDACRLGVATSVPRRDFTSKRLSV
jgi:hypothetical protein